MEDCTKYHLDLRTSNPWYNLTSRSFNLPKLPTAYQSEPVEPATHRNNVLQSKTLINHSVKLYNRLPNTSHYRKPVLSALTKGLSNKFVHPSTITKARKYTSSILGLKSTPNNTGKSSVTKEDIEFIIEFGVGTVVHLPLVQFKNNSSILRTQQQINIQQQQLEIPADNTLAVYYQDHPTQDLFKKYEEECNKLQITPHSKQVFTSHKYVKKATKLEGENHCNIDVHLKSHVQYHLHNEEDGCDCEHCLDYSPNEQENNEIIEKEV